MLRRFLRARDLDVEKAAGMFLKYLKWRRTFVPNGFISEAEIQYDLSHNKMFLGGFDKQGRPINIVFGARHFQNPKQGGPDEFKRMIFLILDALLTFILLLYQLGQACLLVCTGIYRILCLFS